MAKTAVKGELVPFAQAIPPAVLVSDDISLPPRYIACRTYGHAWDRIESITWTPYVGTPLTLLCMRCGTERHDSVDGRSGRLLARSMVYAEGYLLRKGIHRPMRQEWRLHLLQQSLAAITVGRR